MIAMGWASASSAASPAAATAQVAGEAATPASASVAQATGVAAKHQIAMTLPLMLGDEMLADVPVQVAADGSSVAVNSQSLRTQLDRILNPSGVQRLDGVIGGLPYVTLSSLDAAGFPVTFDTSALELTIGNIDSSMRRVQILSAEVDNGDRIPSVPSAGFSAYLNIGTYVQYQSNFGGFENPDIYFYGATRLKNVVLQYDTAFTRKGDGDYGFQRRGVRAVFDDPRNERRYSAGDLRVTTLPILETPFIGGFGVEKRREIFDPFGIPPQAASHRIVIDSPSTVQIIVNGSINRTLDLKPGVYDLRDLPVQYGSNDVQLRINNGSGRQQVANFGYYYDPIDLRTGEDEYVATVGFVSNDFGIQPHYGGDLSFIGFYRKALTDHLALGGAVQASQHRQVVAAQARVVSALVPGAFDLQTAVSLGQGTGFSVQAGYRWAGADSVVGRRFTATVYYRSSAFHLLNELFPSGESELDFSASYSQNLTQRSGFTAGLTYFRGGRFGSERSVYVDYYRQLSQRIRATFGAEYGDGGIYPHNFGVRVGISVALGRNTRLNSTYQSRRDSGQISLSHGVENHVGSFGYDATLNDNQGDTSGDISAYYTGNRFDGRVSVIGNGQNGFGSFADNPGATLQLATSLAFADGTFGMGRPIADSFALVRPHQSLRDKHVIAGRALSDGNYEARSGALGAAVVPDISSYNSQDVLYDIDNLPPGYDIGSGIVHLRPPFSSGSVVVVGSANFVSAVGTLQVGGAPASLLVGTVTSADDKQFQPQPFFTNSVGRFSVLGLAPGKTYSVKLANGAGFTISVPADNTGIYRLHVVKLPAADE